MDIQGFRIRSVWYLNSHLGPIVITSPSFSRFKQNLGYVNSRKLPVIYSGDFRLKTKGPVYISEAANAPSLSKFEFNCYQLTTNNKSLVNYFPATTQPTSGEVDDRGQPWIIIEIGLFKEK